ncbi:PREDICTED: carbonic anhydrase 15-like [Nanorana parkeri]|uniref:carbonic anhydrase 15-like n=1 Tax=Nanorana parkeri TaxID=125878 RepID=UPI000854A90F|nr:PREDICTED: carbonic anhydrase 15-like [Nanorana parkeri]
MKMLQFVLTFITLIVQVSGGGQWCYSSQNPACGPDHWKDINHNCGGDHQSPINIEKAKAKKDSHLGDITFKGYDHAPPAEWKLMNEGHSVMLSLSGDISISGANLPNTYRALQFHFHWGSPTKDGSEHTVDGKQFPLELHIVHMNDKYSSVTEAKKDPQGLAVLGILITVGETDNPSYSSLVSAMKNISLEGDYVLLTPTFPLESLLPAHEKLSSYYRYQGSLTTPDCSQAVIWTVFEQPVTISKTQHQILTDTAHFSAQGETLVKMKDNFRPPQPLKGRQVWASRDATVSCSSGLCAPVLTLCMISLTARILLN